MRFWRGVCGKGIRFSLARVCQKGDRWRAQILQKGDCFCALGVGAGVYLAQMGMIPRRCESPKGANGQSPNEARGDSVGKVQRAKRPKSKWGARG